MKKWVSTFEHVGGILLAFILIVMIGLIMPFSPVPTGSVVLENLDINENIGDKYRVLTEQNWIGLRGGTIRTQEGKTDYVQNLVFRDVGADDELESCTVRFERDELGVVGDFLHCPKGDDIFEYQLIFTEGLEGEVVGKRIEDFEDVRFMMLGQEFRITQAETNGNRIRLRLSGRAVEKFMLEGEKHTIVYDDEPYVVRIVMISDTTPPKVIIEVNGQTSSALEEKKTLLIKNKFPVIISEILPNEGAEGTGGDRVVLIFGARTVDIRDNDYTDDKYTRSDVRVNGVRIIDSKIKIKAVRSNNFITISSIAYRLQAAGPHGDVYIPAGQGLAENLRNPSALLSSAWDLQYGGVGDTPRYFPRASGSGTIKFDAHGDGYDLEFTNNRGVFYDVPFLTKRGGTLAYGDDTEDLHFSEGSDASDYIIGERDYFILTKGSRGQGDTHILQFEGTANGKAIFTDLSGSTKMISLFPTGAFFWLDHLFNRNRIEVPLRSLTGFQTLDAGTESALGMGVEATSEPEADPEPEAEPEADNTLKDGAADAAADEAATGKARQDRLKSDCDKIIPMIEPALANKLAGQFGLYERDGELSMKILGASEFKICSEFFNFMMVEGLFPLKPDAFVDDCVRIYQERLLKDNIKICPNYDELLKEIERACWRLIPELIEEINEQEFEIRRVYRNKCLPQLDQEIDDWNRARGITTPGPSSSNLVRLPDGTFVDADSLPDGSKPSSDTTSVGGTTILPPSEESGDDSPATSEFICCEFCPSRHGERYYFPFYGNDCEPGDVRRQLDEEQCSNPMVLKLGPLSYAPDCPDPKDVEREQKCKDEKEAFNKAKERYDKSIQTVTAARQLYEMTKTGSAQRAYERAVQDANDIYFRELIPARNNANELCEGFADSTSPPPQTVAAGGQPDAGASSGVTDGTSGGAADGTISGVTGGATGTTGGTPSGTSGGTATDGDGGTSGQQPPSVSQPVPQTPSSAPPSGTVTPPSTLQQILQQILQPQEEKACDELEKAVETSEKELAAEAEKVRMGKGNAYGEIHQKLTVQRVKLGMVCAKEEKEMRPKADKFDLSVTTDFSKKTEEELRHVRDMKIGKRGVAKIEFGKEIDVTGLDLNELISISHNKVTIDSEAAPVLNTPATITLENIDMEEPFIYRNGMPCIVCKIVSYDRETKTLVFTTERTSTFEAIDSAGMGRGTLTLSGGSFEFFVNEAGDMIVVDLDGDGDLDGSNVDIHTMGYGILDLGAAGNPTDVVLRTLARYTADKASDELTTIRFSLVNSRPAITLPVLRTYEAGDWEYGMTDYGARFSIEDKSRNNDLIIDYPTSGRRTAGVSIVVGD